MDDLWSKATPLNSNQDFRKLLETPRPHQRGAFKRPQNQQTPQRTPKEGDGKFKKPPPKKVSAKPTKEEEDAGAYRDRAKERREGVNVDYQQIEAELVGRGVISVEALSMEDTKFLGGDLDHTHLVKGLDYALLQKERMRMTKEQEEAATKERTAAKQAQRTAAAVAVRREELVINSPVARNIFETLFNPPKVDVKQMFLPRRTAFVYEFDPEEGMGLDTDIPTTLRRSKADCPPVQETIFANVDGGVLERIAKIMSYMKFNTGGKPGKKLKKKEKEELLAGVKSQEATLKGNVGGGAAAAPPKPKDEDEDIFGDGTGADYKPELPERTKKSAPTTSAPTSSTTPTGAAAAGAGKKGDRSYFGDMRDDMADIPVPLDLRGGSAAAAAAPGPTMPSAAQLASVGNAYPPPPPPPGFNAYGAGYPGAYGGDAYGGGYVDPAVAYMDPAAYEAYVQANIAYQASMDPEYQALLAKQAALQQLEAEGFEEGEEGGPATGPGGRVLTQQEKDAGLASVFKRDDTKWRAKAADEKEKDPGYVGDAYAECYPGYMAFSAEVVDSDDEDLSKMDTRGKGGASRYDFATEEEWEKYKESKEAMPKAAFQFGVKMTDGRKTHKGLEKAKDQKLDTQLHKIERFLQDKSGSKHDDAFGRTPKRGGGANFTDTDITMNTKKRQRI